MRRLFIIVATAFGFVVVGAVPALAVEDDGTQ